MTTDQNQPGFLIDMDGVVYRGDRPIPEAVAFIHRIRKHPFLFLTNNSAVTPREVLEKLKRMGIDFCGEHQILTSAIATADYLHGLTAVFTYYAVGGPGLHEALEKRGRPVEAGADYVVVGEGEGLDYDSLTRGINLLLNDRATLIGTNPDVNLDGVYHNMPAVLPGGGALIAPFQAATGIEPEFIGKPNFVIYQMALQRLKKPAGKVVMIGDRPDTDIKGAAEAGIRTILVCTGRYQRSHPYPAGVPRADLTVESLREVGLSLIEKITGD